MTDTVLEPPVDPTIEVDGALSPVEVRLCPGCGKPESQWRGNDGRSHLAEDGHTYCCRGCADQIGCTCVPEREPAGSRRKGRTRA